MTSKRIRVAGDSVCDLPEHIVSALDIRIIPTYVNIGSESIPDDGRALSREQFYRDLPTMPAHPTTAAPSPGDAEAFYRAMFDEGAEHIVSIHVPEKLSGVMNAMRLGAEATGAEKVSVVDSLQLTFGIGLQVWAAAELAAQDADLGRHSERDRARETVQQSLCDYRYDGVPAPQWPRERLGGQHRRSA